MPYGELRAWLVQLLAAASEQTTEARQDFVLDAYLVACALYQCQADGSPAHLSLGLGPVPRKLVRLIDVLADEVMRSRDPRDGRGPDRIMAPMQRLKSIAAHFSFSPGHWRRVAGMRAKLPACFRSMDLCPEDCASLASLLVAETRLPEVSTRGVLVAGVRTSGCYLAPLVVAALRARGVRSHGWVTVRPDKERRPQGLDRWTSRRAARAGAEGSVVAIVDDPPATGESVRQVASLLSSHLPSKTDLVALLPSLGPSGQLVAHDAISSHVTLAWDDWHVVQQLRPDRLRAVLQQSLVGRSVAGLNGEELTVWECVSVEAGRLSNPGRGHTSCHVRATLATRQAGPVVCDLLVQGVGVGYLGAHALEVHRRLQRWLPRAYGVVDGLLVRDYFPERSRVSELDFRQNAYMRHAIVGYVSERAGKLALDDKVASGRRYLGILSMGGHHASRPVPSPWRVLVDACGPWRGALGRLSREKALAAERQFVAGTLPCLIDGDMGPHRWYLVGGKGLYKTAAHQRALSNYDLECADAMFDAVGAATGAWPPPSRHWAPGPGEHLGGTNREEALADLAERERLNREFRLGWEGVTGGPADAGRWLAYTLFQHLAASRDLLRAAVTYGDRGSDQVLALRGWLHGQLANRALQRHLGPLYGPTLRPARPASSIVAVDIDGVLETYWMGMPAASAVGLSSLRALAAHGLCPVLATGRPLEELRSRCAAYGLEGGVAEYGSSIWVTSEAVAVTLVPAEGADALRALCAVLDGLPRVFLHPGTMASVRASVITAEGFLALPLELAERAIAIAGAKSVLDLHQGRFQTDFVVATVDKVKGLEALAKRLTSAETGTGWLAAAVGDDEPDVEMLRSAEVAFVPDRCSRSARDAASVVVRGDQAQVLPRLASQLIGHRPGTCGLCRTVGEQSEGLGAVLDGLLDVRHASGVRRWLGTNRAVRQPSGRRAGA